MLGERSQVKNQMKNKKKMHILEFHSHKILKSRLTHSDKNQVRCGGAGEKSSRWCIEMFASLTILMVFYLFVYVSKLIKLYTLSM